MLAEYFSSSWNILAVAKKIGEWIETNGENSYLVGLKRLTKNQRADEKKQQMPNTVYKQVAGFCGLVGFSSSHLALVTGEDESLR